MMISPAGRLAFLALAGLAVASWWLNQRLEDAAPATEERPAPDGYYMTEAEITTAGADGLPRYRVIADEIRQTALGGPTRLREVRVEYNIYSPNPWLLTAPEGVLSADQAVLELWGGVAVIGESGDHGRTAAEMERLEVDTTTHVARTASPVDLSFGAQQVSGTGMVAYLLEERVQLQSKVHGRFLP
jgi:lipopolysaccharide export system protein LptC